MKNKIIFTITASICMFLACSKSDDTPVSTPEFSYEQSIFESDFYQEGKTSPPDVDWNGNIGLFGLENSITGVSINTLTGAVSWGKTLPIGSARANEIRVIAYNNAGLSVSSVFLENRFRGSFKGEYSRGGIGLAEVGTQYIGEFEFSSEGFNGGLLILNSDGEIIENITVEGTWNINLDDITAQYTFINHPEVDSRQMQAKLFYTDTEAYIEGVFEPMATDGNDEQLSTFKFYLVENPE